MEIKLSLAISLCEDDDSRVEGEIECVINELTWLDLINSEKLEKMGRSDS